MIAEKFELALGQKYDLNPCGMWIIGPRYFAIGHVVSLRGKHVFSYDENDTYKTFEDMQNAYNSKCVDHSNYFNTFGTENE